MLARSFARALLPLALTFPCLASATAQAPNEGYVDAGGGVRLFYRIVGTGNDTVVVLHGGPGFTMEYLATDLEPLAGDTRSSSTTNVVLDGRRWSATQRRWTHSGLPTIWKLCASTSGSNA